MTFNEAARSCNLNRVLVDATFKAMPVVGAVEVCDSETVLKFVPTKPWPRGTYAIEVDTNLEDLTGNSIARPFETTMNLDPSQPATASKIAIEFAAE